MGNNVYQSWYSNSSDACLIVYDAKSGGSIASYSPPVDIRLGPLLVWNADKVSSWNIGLVEATG
jgi:hypothetical protein